MRFFISILNLSSVKDPVKAVILALIAVLIWSTVASAFKLTLDHMDPATMVFIASIVSLVSIGMASLFNGEWKHIVNCRRKDILQSMLIGLLNPFIYYIVLFGSYDKLPAQIAQSINYSWPVVFTILSILILKQRISMRSISGVIIGFMGVIIVSTKGLSLSGEGVDPLGIILAAGSAIIWAVFWTLNLGSREHGGSRLFFNFLGGSILISLFLLIKGATVPDFAGWIGATYIGLFEMGITFLIWMKALSLSKDNSKIAMLIYLSPFISLVFINTLTGESILISTVLGLIIIVAGIIFQRTEKKYLDGNTD